MAINHKVSGELNQTQSIYANIHPFSCHLYVLFLGGGASLDADYSFCPSLSTNSTTTWHLSTCGCCKLILIVR